MSALNSKDLTSPRLDKVSVSLVIVVIQYEVVYEDFSFICIKTVFSLSVKFFEILLLADSHPSVPKALKAVSFLSFKQFLFIRFQRTQCHVCSSDTLPIK